MNEDYDFLKKRFVELALKADSGSYYTFTDFLGLAEQSAFSEILSKIKGIRYVSFGGAEGCERVMVRFGNEEEIGYDIPFPISVIKVSPLSQKFADKLSHRDFLGSLMNLGISRDTIGDIAIVDNVGYVFAKEDIAPFIADGLNKIKHTDVKCEICDSAPEGTLFRTEPKRVQASSERIDSLIAKVFSLSRDDAQRLFPKKLVFINGRICESLSHTPRQNDVISVRGHGRMIYRGFDSLTRKGKLNITVDLYI